MLKLGILGSGMIVRELMGFIQKLHFEKVYILGRERSKERTEQMVREHHLTGSFYDYEKLLSSDADVIYVALPNFLHYAFAERALECGKHVILEKPAASNTEELQRLVQLAEKQKRMLFEAMNIHALPSYRALKEDLAGIGRPRLVCLNFSQYSSRYDAFLQGDVHPVFEPEKAGGALMDINVYNVHALLGLFGVPKDASYHANVDRGIDTSGMLFCNYETFQAVGIGAKDCKAPSMSTIQGERGTILIEKPVNQMTEYRIQYVDGREELRRFGQTEHRMYYEFMEFIRMIEKGDWETHQKLLELSCAAAKLMTETRQKEGIWFPADRQ